MALFSKILLSASFASLTNFFFRKSARTTESISSYACAQYLCSFLLSFLFFDNFSEVAWSPMMTGIGMGVGTLNILLTYLTSLALKKGPTGAIFAFQNASAMFPGLILFCCFGPNYGYTITPFQLLGIGLIVSGLGCFAIRSPSQIKTSNHTSWLPYAFGCFLVQVIALTLMQWRCLLFCKETTHFLIPMTLNEAEDVWFMPGFFGSAFVLQSLIAWLEGKPLHSKDIACGFSGGITNGLSTFFLLLATKSALPAEQPMLFPYFAVLVILLCSAWAKILYQERFDIVSNSMCSLGIVIGSL